MVGEGAARRADDEGGPVGVGAGQARRAERNLSISWAPFPYKETFAQP